jgi:hypothetical protein
MTNVAAVRATLAIERRKDRAFYTGISEAVIASIFGSLLDRIF